MTAQTKYDEMVRELAEMMIQDAGDLARDIVKGNVELVAKQDNPVASLRPLRDTARPPGFTSGFTMPEAPAVPTPITFRRRPVPGEVKIGENHYQLKGVDPAEVQNLLKAKEHAKVFRILGRAACCVFGALSGVTGYKVEHILDEVSGMNRGMVHRALKILELHFLAFKHKDGQYWTASPGTEHIRKDAWQKFTKHGYRPRVVRRVPGYITQFYNSVSVTPSALCVLNQFTSAPITVGQLHSKVGPMHKSTINGCVRSLEKAGLIKFDSDRAQHYISVAGMEFRDRYYTNMGTALEAE